nr:MAG TPA: hypothetical protein [Caudoviricetes sp.]
MRKKLLRGNRVRNEHNRSNSNHSSDNLYRICILHT